MPSSEAAHPRIANCRLNSAPFWLIEGAYQIFIRSNRGLVAPVTSGTKRNNDAQQNAGFHSENTECTTYAPLQARRRRLDLGDAFQAPLGIY